MWNAVEKIEKAKNSQLAREIELALPLELTREQNVFLVRNYVERHFVAQGMCADICIHDKNGENPHVHIMLTMRPFYEDSTWGDKQKKEYILSKDGKKIYEPKKRQYKCKSVPTTDWNDQTKAEKWRSAWEDAANSALEKHGHTSRIDHRSYERQGIEQIPTIHMGVAATQMERRGISTERGNQNRKIARLNQMLFSILTKLKQFKDWLKEALTPTAPPTQTVSPAASASAHVLSPAVAASMQGAIPATFTPSAPPTLAEILQALLARGEQPTRYGQIRDLKAAARVFAFMQEHSISTMSELRDKISEIHKPYNDTRNNLNWLESQMKILETHIKQGAIYSEHKSIYTAYQQLRTRKQPRFYEEHRAPLMLFEAAKRYLDEHHIKPDSLNDWKKEHVEVLSHRSNVYREYASLKTQFETAYSVRRDAENLIRDINRPQQQRKTIRRDMEKGGR